MDTNNRRSANNKRKAAIAQSIPSPPQAVAPGGVSAIAWFTHITGIIAVISAVSYLLTISYELAFCDYFYIPYYLISLNPTIVLSTMLNIYIPLFPIVFFVNLAIVITPSLIKTRRRSFIFYLIFTILCIVNLSFDKKFKKDDILYIIYMALLVISLIILIIGGFILKRKKGESWWNEPATKENTTETPLSMPYTITGSVIALILLPLVFFGAYGMSSLGKYAAEHQKEFVVIAPSPEAIAPSPEAIVIRSYGEYLLVVPFSPVTQQFERTLVIMKMSEMTKTKLIMKDVGPLKPKPIEPKL